MVYWHSMYMVAQKWKNEDVVRKYRIRRALESSKANTKCNSSISGSKGLDGSAFQLCGQQYVSFPWTDCVPCIQLSFFRYHTTLASLSLLVLYWKSGYAFTSSTMASHNLLPSQMLTTGFPCYTVPQQLSESTWEKKSVTCSFSNPSSF